MKLPSASAMQRAFSCLESFSLPQVEEESSAEAQRGTTVHAFLRNVLSGDMTREDALELVPEDDEGRAACETADLSQLPRGGLHEAAVAWNPETDEARILGFDIGRRYEEHGADRTREVVMSIDLCGDLLDRRVFVFDFKTGRPQVSARDSWQLRTGAVIWSLLRGADESLTGHIIINDDVRYDLWEVDAIALADHKAQIRQQMRRLSRLRRRADLRHADVVEGEHCKYCPAFTRCPAKTGLVRQMASMVSVRDGVGGQLVTPETAARVWRALDQYDEVAKRLRAQVEKLVARDPIDLGDGYELRMAPGVEKDVITNHVLAIGALAHEFGIDAAKEGATASKKGLSAVARKHGGEERVASFLGKLRDAGVLVKKPGEVKVREVKKERSDG